MKNILKIGILALLSIMTMVACDPQEDNDYSLGRLPNASELSFTATPSAANANIIEFKNTSKVAGVTTWNLGEGTSLKGESVSNGYPYKGTYTITMTLYTTGGAVSTTSQITIAQDNPSLLNTPNFTALTGGPTKLEGKTWVFDQYVSGYFGLGPADGATASWWNAGPDEKAGSSLFTQEFTFIQDGLKLVWKNNAYIYTNGAGKNALPPSNFVENPGGVGDFDVAYTPKNNLTFSLNEATMTLTLSDGAFLGHYAGTSEYKIVKLTDNELYVRCNSKVEPSNAWYYRFIPIEKRVKPVIPIKEKPLAEDFEKTVPAVSFTSEAMGLLTSASYSNPAPVPVDTSSKVFLYQKSNDFYSNVYYKTNGYKFDLTNQHKVKLKVYIPSYNDYTKDNSTAGNWIKNAKLRPQVSVKLQDSSRGSSSWETQTEIIKDNLPTNTWIDLEFDFSIVSTNKNYDKIVIQFGGEGHSGTGIFFFDNFEFTK
ncbi:PKD domain-containing protein [uncultured Acetobacteroides sp.]|uniref:PKD domain-containing protein n=1 Tax=uncultured Acetobacteroides sp. TaxID=1760811 RepID=UPI0029F498D3|nr:hypothetical protein [uncultured Acetobacteroides sp.]